MAIFKPESSGSFTDYLGICEIALMSFTDKSKDFEWADIFIEVTVKQKGSDYDKPLQIKGSLERENGVVTGGSVLKRMYHFFEQIGCSAGINVQGNWEDENGDEIKDIASYLNQHHSSLVMPDTDPDFNYLAYVYKEKPKQKGGKVYSRVFHKVQKNDLVGRTQLESDVKWFKNKGFLKEASESDTQTPTQSVEMSQNGIGNL